MVVGYADYGSREGTCKNRSVSLCAPNQCQLRITLGHWQSVGRWSLQIGKEHTPNAATTALIHSARTEQASFLNLHTDDRPTDQYQSIYVRHSVWVHGPGET